MDIKVYARQIDTKLRLGIYAMAYHAMLELCGYKNPRLDKIQLNIRLKKHKDGGEAFVVDVHKRNPKKFEVIIDTRKFNIDEYGRRRSDTEWAHKILETVGHECVHVKQYMFGELRKSPRTSKLFWLKKWYQPKNLIDYYWLPYEVEAHGKERAILLGFLTKWKQIEKKLDNGNIVDLNKEIMNAKISNK